MRIVATYNIKGGVGKTSAAVNLAYLASEDGYRTLLWDLDPQAAASYVFRVRPRVKGGAKALTRGTRPLGRAIKGTDFDGLDLLPADFTYRHMDLALHRGRQPTRRLSRLLGPLAGEYDVVFLDGPPGISLVSENILGAADTLLVPLIPTTLSERTFDQLTAFVANLDGRRPDVLAFFSMVDRRKRLHREVMARLPAERDGIAAAVIPAMTLVEQMAVRRAPVPAFAPRSAAARRYRQLWSELRARTQTVRELAGRGEGADQAIVAVAGAGAEHQGGRTAERGVAHPQAPQAVERARVAVGAVGRATARPPVPRTAVRTGSAPATSPVWPGYRPCLDLLGGESWTFGGSP